MKKLKLKKWVKVALIVIGLIGAVMIDTIMTYDAVNQCVDSGNNYNYCVSGLR